LKTGTRQRVGGSNPSLSAKTPINKDFSKGVPKSVPIFSEWGHFFMSLEIPCILGIKEDCKQFFRDNFQRCYKIIVFSLWGHILANVPIFYIAPNMFLFS